MAALTCQRSEGPVIEVRGAKSWRGAGRAEWMTSFSHIAAEENDEVTAGPSRESLLGFVFEIQLTEGGGSEGATGQHYISRVRGLPTDPVRPKLH